MRNVVTLRPLAPSDADVIAAWADDPDFCREADWTPGLSRQVRAEFHRQLILTPPVDLVRLGAVEGGALVGYCDLAGVESGRRELGFVVGERANWNRGLGRGIAAAGLDYAFGEFALGEVWAEALDANPNSIRLLRHLGFLETGRGADAPFRAHHSFYRQFVITAGEWEQHRQVH